MDGDIVWLADERPGNRFHLLMIRSDFILFTSLHRADFISGWHLDCMFMVAERYKMDANE